MAVNATFEAFASKDYSVVPKSYGLWGKKLYNVIAELRLTALYDIVLEESQLSLPQSKWLNSATKWSEIAYPDIYDDVIKFPGNVHLPTYMVPD